MLSCPLYRAFVERSCVRVQTFMRSQQHSYLLQTFLHSCPDFRAFIRLLYAVHAPILMHSPDFRAFMSRLSFVHQIFMRSCADFLALISFLVRSPIFREFISRLSCVFVQTFVRSPDFCACMFRLCSIFPDYVILNARRLPLVRSFSVWTYLLPSGTVILVCFAQILSAFLRIFFLLYRTKRL